MNHHPRARLIGVAAGLGASVLSLTPMAAPAKLTARFWSIDPDSWKKEARAADPPEAFPETAGLALRTTRKDFGIAFSGGGTRAAAATIGQLRGLDAQGWLAKARYITAVSGGSWTVVPYIYADKPLADLLGPSLPVDRLSKAVLETDPEPGSLALSVVKSKLAAHSAVEVGEFLARRRAARAETPATLRLLIDRLVKSGSDRTFADLLRRVFLEPVLGKADVKLRYGWDRASVDGFVDGNPLGHGDFFMAARDRPFPIIGGTIIATHPAYDYPLLIPLEMTPLYSGVRQRFGPKLGGAYMWPFACGTTPDSITGETVSLTDGVTPFTLADSIAISGAAPLLTLFLGQPHAALKQGVQFFPTFTPFTVVDGKAVVSDGALSHGDGGFTDNLGLMPLLARGVKNIIVFVNAKESVGKNPTVESFFRKFPRQSGSGDLGHNKVFATEKYGELLDGLERAARGKGAAVYCGVGWAVEPNEVYNIRSYGDVNICWVYNQRVPAWEDQLPLDARELLKTKRFRHFPWYSTFEENKPYVIRLSSAQVNALSHLAEWTVTEPKSAAAIENALGRVLK